MRDLRQWVNCICCAMIVAGLSGCIAEHPAEPLPCESLEVDGAEYCVLADTRAIHETGFRCVDARRLADPVCPAALPVCNDSAFGPFCADRALPEDEAERIGRAFGEGDPMGEPEPQPEPEPMAEPEPEPEPMPEPEPEPEPEPGQCPPPQVLAFIGPYTVGDRVQMMLPPNPGAPGAWQWSMLSRPLGSTAQVASDGLRAAVVIDLIGRYRVRATSLRPGCDAIHEFEFEARPPGGIYAHLTWTRADGEPAPDDGPDLDISLRHELGGDAWTSGPFVCDFLNPIPEWGVAGPEGNASLDRDSLDGTPEVIAVPEPEDGVRYGVAVHAYELDPRDQPGAGSVALTATARIYLDGELRHEAEVDFATEGQMVWVADVVWCDVAVPGCNPAAMIELDGLPQRWASRQGPVIDP